MKRYNKIIFKGLFLAGLIGLFSSCEDFLTRDKPNASTDDDFWKTQQECESALGTCKLWLRGDWGGDEIGMVFQDGASDNVYFTGNFDVRIQQLGNGSLVPPPTIIIPVHGNISFTPGTNVTGKSAIAVDYSIILIMPILRMSLNATV